MNEAQLEDQSIDWFKELGWSYQNGQDIAPDSASPERTSYHQVLLESRLLDSLAKINKHVPASCLDQVLDVIKKPDHPILEYNNRWFHNLLLEGVSVEFEKDGQKQSDIVSLIDYNDVDNNDFLVVNQFTITGTKGNRRPDVIVFVNGLPLVVIELKNPSK